MARKKKKRPMPPAAAVPVPARNRISGGPLLWGILALALAVRMAHLALNRESPFFEPILLDPDYYHKWALRIATGDFGNEVFFGLPLYPFFLGLIYKLTSGSLMATKLAQVALGLVTLFFVWKSAEKIASRRAAFIATLLGACYGPLFFHEGILIPEAIAMPLYAAAFYVACLFTEAPSVRRGAIAGLLFGLAALSKAGIIPFTLAFVAISAIRFRRAPRGLLPVLACAAAFLATLAPVTLHNFIKAKDAVLLTSHAGSNFYIGNNTEAEGVFKPAEGTGWNVEGQIEDTRAQAERALGRKLKASEVSKYWSDKAWEWIRNNPVDFLRLSGRKLLLFMDGREISDVDDYAFSRRFNALLRFPWPDFYWLGPLALLGFLIAAAGGVRHRWIVIAWISGYLGGLVFFFINGRYRLPLLGLFLPLAGLATAEVVNKARERNWRRLALYALVLAAGVILTRLELVHTSWARNLVNTGDIYLSKNDIETAMKYYREGLAADPESAKGNLAMGIALTRMGKSDEAKDYYVKSLAIDPTSSLAYNNIGLWHEKQGDEKEAERCFLKAIELKPRSPQAYNNLGMLHGKRGEQEKALEYFEKSLALNPASARALTNSGLILYRLGRHEEAVRRWEEAVRIDPAFQEAKKALGIVKHSDLKP